MSQFLFRCTFIPEVGNDHNPHPMFQDLTAEQAVAKLRELLFEDWDGSEGYYEEMKKVQDERLLQLTQAPKWGIVIPTFYGSYAVTV